MKFRSRMFTMALEGDMKKILILAWVLSIGAAAAMTTFKVKVKCPLDGEEFEFLAQGSGTSFGVMLDGKPFGAIITPWPIAKCPKDGLVFYKNDFLRIEAALLKPFVESSRYQSLQKSETNYWLAYLLSKHLSAPLDEQVSLMVKATWEASEDERYERYAKETIEALGRIKNPSADMVFLSGELNRRIGKFDKAAKIFSALEKKVEEGSFLAEIISKEFELIAKKDSSPHPAR